MRVLQVSSYFAPAWAYGGPPRVMFDFAQGLVAGGHDVTVFTTDALDEAHRARPLEEDLGGIRVVRFPNLSNDLAWRRKKFLPRRLLSQLLREIRDHDVVHATDARTYATLSAHLAALRSGVPLCLSAHGSLPGSRGLRGVVKAGYDRAFVRPMLERASRLFAQTGHESRLYLESGGRPEAVALLPLPVRLPAEIPPRRNGSLRTRLGLGARDPLALFLGRIHPLKGVDLLVEALEPLLRARELTLAVIGRDDGHWSELDARFAGLTASGSLSFVGPLYGDERFAAYADADVFCLTPPHFEETSLATLEAAGSGTPVVVTEQAEIPNLTEGGGGFVVPLDARAVRDAVIRAVAESDAMGARARALVAEQHDSQKVGAQLEQHLLAAVAGR